MPRSLRLVLAACAAKTNARAPANVAPARAPDAVAAPDAPDDTDLRGYADQEDRDQMTHRYARATA